MAMGPDGTRLYERLISKYESFILKKFSNNFRQYTCTVNCNAHEICSGTRTVFLEIAVEQDVGVKIPECSIEMTDDF